MVQSNYGRPKFTKQLSKALKKLKQDEPTLIETDNEQLYSLVYDRGYKWITLVATDGLLIRERETAEAAGRRCKILIGVVIQSEQSTSQTKPNPLGKAAAAMTPLGLWVDVKRDGNVTRERLDVVRVLLLVPEPTDPARMKKHPMVRQNVENVVDTIEHAHMLACPQGDNAVVIAEKVMKKARGWLFGSGRPKRK